MLQPFGVDHNNDLQGLVNWCAPPPPPVAPKIPPPMPPSAPPVANWRASAPPVQQMAAPPKAPIGGGGDRSGLLDQIRQVRAEGRVQLMV